MHFLLIFFALFNSAPQASEFLSTKFQVSVRSAPSTSSYVKWVYLKKNEPVKVLSTFGNWKKIKDCDNDTGWVHISALSAKRFLVAQAEKNLYAKQNQSSKVLARIKPGVRCELKSAAGKWLQIRASSITGWITSDSVWGI
jgi:SH3-like domain-containing protein